MTTEAKLKNGEIVKVNDHVFAAAPWEKRDPVPYSIGRIIEFIPPDDTSVPQPRPHRGRPVENTMRVRVAWFYRPTDVQDKGFGDHRLLLAALFSEIIPFSNVRGKCIVRHRDKIGDLTAYKKKDDRFYFHQLFDPFTKDNYEVILSTDIHNLPGHIKEVLVSRYEFVVCERDTLPDLQDNLRLCETCGDWCPGPESVMCELCKKHYHMACVNPPLLSKPSRGYGWSCASCNNRRENNEFEVATSKNRQSKDLAIAAAKARAKSKNNPKVDEEVDRYWKGWSFRYFGQHTVAEDTLDPEDMIYVRAPTRVGKLFQVQVPPVPEGPSQDPEIPVRGEADTIELLSNVVHMSEAQMAEVERRKNILTPRADLQRSVDYLEEIIRRFSEAWVSGNSFYSVNIRNPLCKRKWKEGEVRYRDKDWDEVEESIFDESVRKHHSELRHVRTDLKVRPRTMAEIVRHFGHWKAEQLHLLYLLGPPAPLPAPSTKDDDNTSIYQKNDRRVYTCAVCRTKESTNWWKAPRNLSTNTMCDDCGMMWRKYAIKSAKGTDKEKEYLARVQQNVGTPEPPSTRSGAALGKGSQLAAKREGTPQKKIKLTSGAATPLKLVCSLCRKSGPVGQVVKCSKCGFTIHGGCIGVPIEDVTPNWMCEICSNEQTQESNLDTACRLCPPQPAERKKGARDSAFFRAAKPTEFRGWVHVLCATFNNQLEYEDATRMRLVEGMASIPQRNYQHKCGCCGGTGGCLSQCDQCLTTFHPVCAWNHGFKFGIEFVSVKPSQRKEYPVVEFRGEIGNMNAVILCDNHSGHSKKVYELCDLDEKGRTALQVFTENYKQASNSDRTFSLLRKARRLDEVVPAPRFDAVPALDPASTLPTNNRCIFCTTEFSPFWWPADALGDIPPVTVMNGVDEDVKMTNGVEKKEVKTRANGSTRPAISSSSTQVDTVMEDAEDEGQVKPDTVFESKICHRCFYVRSEERNQTVAVELNTPIITV